MVDTRLDETKKKKSSTHTPTKGGRRDDDLFRASWCDGAVGEALAV
jgi:hypothetical protein